MVGKFTEKKEKTTKKKEVKEDFLYIFLSVLDKIYLTLDTSYTRKTSKIL